MIGVQATYRHGTVEFSSPVEWPEGTQLEVIPVSIGVASPTPGHSGSPEFDREFIDRLTGYWLRSLRSGMDHRWADARQ